MWPSKVISEVNGHPDVVCFKCMCSYFISNKWYAERQTNTQEESEQIVCTAGKLIASALATLFELGYPSLFNDRLDLVTLPG